MAKNKQDLFQTEELQIPDLEVTDKVVSLLTQSLGQDRVAELMAFSVKTLNKEMKETMRA